MPEFAPVGDGTVNFKSAVAAAKESGAKYFLVEQDNAPDSGDSIGQMKISYNNLKELF